MIPITPSFNGEIALPSKSTTIGNHSFFMISFPVHIKQYLSDNGFSGTELCVLSHLFNGEALTIRQIARKTGKSTGVLDQAMKKLMSKKIVTIERCNGVPHYAATSLDAVTRWIEKESEKELELLQRKKQSVVSFVASLEIERTRPKMEYFRGVDGIQKCFAILLNSGEIMHHILPICTKEEEHPCMEIVDQFKNGRQKRSIESRVITSNSPFGRRYQSNDHLRMRKTVLVPENQLSGKLEKIIVGDVIASIDYQSLCACIIHYPAMAKQECEAFNLLWNKYCDDDPDIAGGRGDEDCGIICKFIRMIKLENVSAD